MSANSHKQFRAGRLISLDVTFKGKCGKCGRIIARTKLRPKSIRGPEEYSFTWQPTRGCTVEDGRRRLPSVIGVSRREDGSWEPATEVLGAEKTTFTCIAGKCRSEVEAFPRKPARWEVLVSTQEKALIRALHEHRDTIVFGVDI